MEEQVSFKSWRWMTPEEEEEDDDDDDEEGRKDDEGIKDDDDEGMKDEDDEGNKWVCWEKEEEDIRLRVGISDDVDFLRSNE